MSAEWHVPLRLVLDDDVVAQLHADDSADMEEAGCEPPDLEQFRDQVVRGVLVDQLGVPETLARGKVLIAAEDGLWRLERFDAELPRISWQVAICDVPDDSPLHTLRQGNGIASLTEAIGFLLALEEEHTPDGYTPGGSLSIYWQRVDRETDS